MDSSTQLPAPSRRFQAMAALWMLGANLLWWTPIVLFLWPVFTSDSQLGSILLLVMLACGTITGGLPLHWLRLSQWEVLRTPYRRIGVRQFRMLVYEGALMNWLVRGSQPFSILQSRASLEKWRLNSLQNERRHWAWLAISLPLLVYAVVTGSYAFAMAFALSNLPLNIYPILLQRDSRARLTRMIARVAPA